MIKTTNMILAELSSYANPKAKLSRLVKEGTYIQIVRGLYETDRGVPRHLLAGSIYGPSYISFAYALGFYGMIPEAVYAVTSATFEKRKNKGSTDKFSTAILTHLFCPHCALDPPHSFCYASGLPPCSDEKIYANLTDFILSAIPKKYQGTVA